jgi:hypothetical protein
MLARYTFTNLLVDTACGYWPDQKTGDHTLIIQYIGTTYQGLYPSYQKWPGIMCIFDI